MQPYGDIYILLSFFYLFINSFLFLFIYFSCEDEVNERVKILVLMTAFCDNDTWWKIIEKENS